MSSNQSGAEKDNRLLFGEQWTLLFSKSKMTATNFSQSGAELRTMDAIVKVVVIDAHMSGNQSGVELRTMDAIVFQIQDGRHKFQPIQSRIKNSRWRRPCWKTAHQASTEDWDRSHRFPWRQITPGSRKNCHATSNSILTVSCGPKRQRSGIEKSNITQCQMSRTLISTLFG